MSTESNASSSFYFPTRFDHRAVAAFELWVAGTRDETAIFLDLTDTEFLDPDAMAALRRALTRWRRTNTPVLLNASTAAQFTLSLYEKAGNNEFSFLRRNAA
jgi:anti-anti-sigma regulatory factor